MPKGQHSYIRHDIPIKQCLFPSLDKVLIFEAIVIFIIYHLKLMFMLKILGMSHLKFTFLVWVLLSTLLTSGYN